jgi:hypothetical protein
MIAQLSTPNDEILLMGVVGQLGTAPQQRTVESSRTAHPCQLASERDT